jgi:hypothetical protein
MADGPTILSLTFPPLFPELFRHFLEERLVISTAGSFLMVTGIFCCQENK